MILPSLTTEQVEELLQKSKSVRDKAIIALFVELGLRLSELTNIKVGDVDWNSHIIKVIGKGNKEGYAPFGNKAEGYLRLWLSEYNAENGERMWNIGFWGIKTMLDKLKQQTGLPCNPHTFRRTFACLLRKAGVDTMTIKDLGRWESLEMVQRYTRSVTFHDSMRLYKAPLG
jgi:integrase/recombinase XerC